MKGRFQVFESVSLLVHVDGKMAKCWDFSNRLMKASYKFMSLQVHESMSPQRKKKLSVSGKFMEDVKKRYD
jgi:hypothetical protein